MSGNSGWSGVNSPSFLKSTRGMFGSLLGTPVSSASRIISKFRNGVPPQKLWSYLAKYQPQLGSRAAGDSIGAPIFSPQISKATCRSAFGVVVSILSTVGSPDGTGDGPVGSCMSTGSPSTTMVARGNGYA